uniref:ATP synthase subunit 9, mitochondrial n=1 Tax=Brassica oleracea var. oleracea TaxID=109376 RepID=A0A0D3D462_BRAOL
MTKREENYQPEMLEGAKSIGAGAATIASAGAAIGIGNVFSSLIHSVARNPSLAKQSFGYAILGFALTEAIALFAPMMAFLILFIKVIHLVSPAWPLLEPIIWAAVGGRALPSTGANGAERDTIREEDSFEL